MRKIAVVDISPFSPRQLREFDVAELERIAIMTVDADLPDAVAEVYVRGERGKKR